MRQITREKINFMKHVLEEDPFYLVIGGSGKSPIPTRT